MNITATTPLVACDGCATVAAAELAGNWRSYANYQRHHCGKCVELNEAIVVYDLSFGWVWQ